MTVALLLAACTGLVTYVAYRAVRRSVTTAASERLKTAADRLASVLGVSVRRTTVAAAPFEQLSHGHAWFATGAGAPAFTATLDSVRHASPQNVAIVIERRAGGLVASGDSVALARAEATPRSGIGPLFVLRDTVRFTIAEVLTTGADTVGRLIVARTLGSGATLAALGGMVASTAKVRIGNADGSLWSDFTTTLPPPEGVGRGRVDSTKPLEATPGTLAYAVPIQGTPWMLWIGQSAADASAPATSIALRLLALGLIVMLLGALVAWVIMLRLTAPLDDLASTADALARGDYRRRVARTQSHDEVRRVALAFNTMAQQIESHSDRLEAQVAERTLTLEHTLDDLHAAQAENVRRERLALLGQLAGGVGHELRNPLGVMTNAVYVLETVLGSDNPMVGEYLGILKGQIALSEKLVADLLDFARTRPPQKAPTDVGALVHHQISRLGPVGKVTIGSEVSSTLRPASVDAVQIGQVVFNLVTNAVQAVAADSGSVVFRARENDDGMIVLDVADTGPGIPVDVATHMFEPLFTTKARGLGLGLTVSRMLAENNGGGLTFVSSPGQGTTFTLTMPVASG